MKYFLLIALFIMSYDLKACSCDEPFFCEYLQEAEEWKMLVVKVKAIEYVDYSDTEYSYIFEVLKVFREDVTIPSTLELFGSYNESNCTVDFKSRIESSKEYYFAIVAEFEDGQGGYDHPPSQFPDYWSFAPSLCGFEKLKIIDNVVKGRIYPSVNHYPLDEFEAALKDCSFSEESNVNAICDFQNYSIYPNPAINGMIKIHTSSGSVYTTSIDIYDSSGRLIKSIKETIASYPSINVELHPGIYFVQLNCSGNSVVSKVLVTE